MTVLEDLQQIAALGGRELGQSPVVQDDDVGSGEFPHDLRIPAIAVGVADFIEHRLRPGRLGIGVIGRAHHCDEHLRGTNLAGAPVDHRGRLPGICCSVSYVAVMA